MTHTAGVPATGTEVGLTDGPTVVRLKTVKKAINAEQSLAGVDVATIQEIAEIEFKCKEQTYAALQRAFDTVGTVTDGSKHLFYGGNGTAVLAPRTEAVMFTSVQRNAPTKYIWTVIYKAFSEMGMEESFSREGETIYSVKMVGLADMTRNAGDQLYQTVFEL